MSLPPLGEGKGWAEYLVKHDALVADRWKPRPRDVLRYRDRLIQEWGPRGQFTGLARLVQATNEFVPEWERTTAVDASLWFVGRDMCALLQEEAPKIPSVKLWPEMVPAECGLVVFETPLLGLDAMDLNQGPVSVGAMMWGRAVWMDHRPVIGITVYGPAPEIQPGLSPLGSLIWPIGREPDDPLNDWPAGNPLREDDLTDAQVASMAEDRRRLLAMWTLSGQPRVTDIAIHRSNASNKSVRRRAGKRPEPPIRIVTLRKTVAASDGDGEETGRHLRYKHQVRGHWKEQAYGPGRGKRRAIFVDEYERGPGRLTDSREKVFSWVR